MENADEFYITCASIHITLTDDTLAKIRDCLISLSEFAAWARHMLELRKINIEREDENGKKIKPLIKQEMVIM